MNKYLISFFHRPISNTRPEPVPVSIFDVYRMVATRRYAPETEALRAITTENGQKSFKASHFDFVTPGGVFAMRNDASLITASNLVAIDLDHIKDVEGLKKALLADSNFDTLLLFRSPRGCGLKWFIDADMQICDYRTWHKGVRNYLMSTYGLTDKQVDPMVGHVSAACFLCYDPEAYLRTDLYEFF